MSSFPSDIFTEPELDPDTLANLGPLRPMAGTWESASGDDEHPVVEGTEQNEFVEHYDLQPIDPQTNGPQVFYGLRYHTHIVKPGEVETFHDQVGYWLWEPANKTVILSLAIPRAQVAMASGPAEPDATSFELTAKLGAATYGICSNPFLNDAFRTVAFRMNVSTNKDGTWSYEEDTVIEVRGQAEPFHHTDRNTLVRVAPPIPNPMAGTPTP
jgi:hypothetical protein